MGLKDTIRKAAVTAVSAVGDLASTFDYKSFSTAELDATNSTVETAHLVYEDVEGVFVDYKEREVDGQNILPRDQMLLIPDLNISFEPKSGDEVTVRIGEDIERWDVTGADLDTARALHVLQVRRVQ